ncbi:Hypothetical protein D9617_10g072290 [Elsinoe fawcettii]|nr:Hypothetical protein D9617_10g072290 [Elsinoe fawcettii]
MDSKDDVKQPSTHLLAVPDSGLSVDSDAHVKRHRRWLAEHSIAWKLNYGFAMLTALTPLLLGIIWTAITKSDHRDIWTLDGHRIGGQMTQRQAKVIDVMCSAVIAPSIATGIFYFWFGSARTSAFNEYNPKKRPIPLKSLISVATSFGGGYDMFDVWTLWRSGTKRLYLLGALTLLSALAKSGLSNLIAYEAFSIDREATGLLRLLTSAPIDNRTFFTPQAMSLGQPGDIAESFTMSQRAEVANRISGMLTGLNFQSASSKLTDGAYIGINATTKSLDQLPPELHSLRDIPGYRLTTSCNTTTPDTFSIIMMGGYTAAITHTFTDSSNWLYNGYYPGQLASISSAYNEVYQYLTFGGPNRTAAYLGSITSFNLTRGTISSPYGPINPAAVNLTSSTFTGTKSIMSYWGIRCVIHRQDGLLTLIRTPGSPWSINSTSFPPSSPSRVVPSQLYNWQTNLKYQAPAQKAAIPGLMPALAATVNDTLCSSPRGCTGASCPLQCDNATDWAMLAGNYLYASAEAEKILYEVAASDARADRAVDFMRVQGTRTAGDVYTITFVPAILGASLLFLLLGALVVLGMGARVWGTFSARTFRDVDTLRLVVDYANLVGGAQGGRVARKKREALGRWAGGYGVVYEREGEGERERVVLRHMGDMSGDGGK